MKFANVLMFLEKLGFDLRKIIWLFKLSLIANFLCFFFCFFLVLAIQLPIVLNQVIVNKEVN
jgi:hypothetical protein